MKTSILYLIFLSTLVASCHRNAAIAPLSCCAKDNAMTTSSMIAGHLLGASIYQLPGSWTDQNNRIVSLYKLKGKIQVVAMIFTHCGYACPRIVEEMKAIEDSLPEADKSQVNYVLVSFDPERDTPSALLQFAIQKQLNNRWELLHGDADQVRELSMLLDVKYQKLSDGNYSHSNTVAVLDKQGDVVRHFDGLVGNTGSAVSTIHQLSNQ
jgi:protein SCO1